MSLQRITPRRRLRLRFRLTPHGCRPPAPRPGDPWHLPEVRRQVPDSEPAPGVVGVRLVRRAYGRRRREREQRQDAAGPGKDCRLREAGEDCCLGRADELPAKRSGSLLADKEWIPMDLCLQAGRTSYRYAAGSGRCGRVGVWADGAREEKGATGGAQRERARREATAYREKGESALRETERALGEKLQPTGIKERALGEKQERVLGETIQPTGL